MADARGIVFAQAKEPSRSGATILLTADGEGHTGPCASCPVDVGLGGLARRATLVAKARQDGPLLLLDGGNAFFGGDSASSEGKVIVAAYDAIGYDAVNISYRDFRRGRDATMALLAGAKFTALSTNLLNEQTNQLLFKPYLIKEIAGKKVAVLGVTEAPAGMGFLPHLKEQLAGVRIRPPVDALDEWLPKARAESDSLVILFYGSGKTLTAIRAKLAGIDAVICVAGIRPEDLPVGDERLVAAEMHGKSLARVTPTGGKVAVTQIAVAPDVPPDAAMTALVENFVPRPVETTTVVNASQPATQPATMVAAVVPQSPAQPETKPATLPSTTAPSVLDSLPRVTAHSDLKPKGLAGVGLSAEQVNLAIERGREFLWPHLRDTIAKEHRRFGQDNGTDLLQALALVHTGAQLKYPEFDAMLREYLGRLDPIHDAPGTYQMGILCMLIGDYADPIYLPKMRLLARSLLEQQLADGSWHYGRVVPESAFGDYKSGPALSVEGGTPLDNSAVLAGPGALRTLPFEEHNPGDNSTSQFAMLGLRAAARVRIRAAPQLWQNSLKAFNSRRCKDGGWGYDAGAYSSYGSMTCAGICSIAIARHELGEKEPAVDPAIETGLAWLDKHFSVTTNPEYGGYLYYYLYSLERVGRILDTEFIGSHEWYPLGAQYLVGAQQADGSWQQSPTDDPVQCSSFALLFLTRATQTLNVEIPRGGQGKVTTSVATPPPARLYVILDASGSMLDTMDGRNKFDIAREAVATLFTDLPDSAEVALRVYGNHKRALEEKADEDTTLEYSMAKLDRPKLKTLLQQLRPRGKTPLALSLTQAKQDLSSVSGAPVTVVLLTDGGEDTVPRRNPVKAAADFATLPGVTFHIVGFDINQADWGVQLRAMAAAAHGRYWPAARAKALQREIRSAVFGIPDDFMLYDSSSREIARGQFGESKTLPEGKYLFKTDFAGQDYKSEIWVNTGSSTAIVFDASHVPAASGPTTAPSRP